MPAYWASALKKMIHYEYAQRLLFELQGNLKKMLPKGIVGFPCGQKDYDTSKCSTALTKKCCFKFHEFGHISTKCRC